ncbi:MAG: hypothetical protein MZU91_05705 [Desulfosudis oleivorans]|nr:hypothetical protein [Desulfosudis oleivorans]
MSRLAVKNLLDKKIAKIFVTNRTRRKITDFKKEFPYITEIDFKNRYEAIGQVDIIISCTSAPHFVIHKDKFATNFKNNSLCILDLAMPRDVEPTIGDINGIKLFKIDDIETIEQENINKRLKAKEKGLVILENNVKKYIKWLSTLGVTNVIKTVQEYSEEIVDKELKTLLKKLGPIDKKQMQIIEKSLVNVAKASNHKYVIKLKEIAGEIHNYEDFLSSKFCAGEK